MLAPRPKPKGAGARGQAGLGMGVEGGGSVRLPEEHKSTWSAHLKARTLGHVGAAGTCSGAPWAVAERVGRWQW